MNNGIDIDALVKLLDDSMENGSGHLDVVINEESKDIEVTVDNCKGASCSVPTLHKDID